MMHKSYYGRGVVCVLLAAVLLCGCGKSSLQNSSGIGETVSEGYPDGEEVLLPEDTGVQGDPREDENAAPDFTVELNDGSQFTLSAAKGKVVLINIWATWCGPCCGEMPAFQRLYEEYGDDLQIVAVNYAEKKKDVDRFAADNGYTFPFAYDEEASVMELYPSDGIPYTILIDKEGRIFKTFLGARSAEEQYQVYHSAIEEAMNEER